MAPLAEALVVGAGPAGLMAAEELAKAGVRTIVCEARPSVARKFLMAGKSGLNVTRDEPREAFVSRYDAPQLRPILAGFGPDEVQQWCRDLGQEIFTGSSGRVFPVAMKASPLLRAWLQRLVSLRVEIRTRWRWSGFAAAGLRFATPEGDRVLTPDATVLALGGASWQRLGSDGAWVPWLREKGVAISDWKPANMGFRIDWSQRMAAFFGQPVKGVALLVGNRRERGEFVISSRGIEGGGIYAVSRDLREGATLALDLLPDLTEDQVAARLARMKPAESTANRLRKLGLGKVQAALVMEWSRDAPLARLKRLPVPLAGPRPLDEAISVAGGVRWDALTPDLELRALPGVFACGEMLDWEAPTGGYLLTACWASGRWAGQRAAARITTA
ncbi:BaiN/RdsA family NAD(P)/FAD-dependent oxidoreductase [Tabrizicola caldifontis]|uniref:NAD(P)/FAD-dependent oxidoreductase n=1 Tax=Tabrizicola caldifontis TaxID=2528036 RepID=UPI001080DA42|nr:TIGR03862 family flavoprotein [Rhodobacter sp. YIM 73028]